MSDNENTAPIYRNPKVPEAVFAIVRPSDPGWYVTVYDNGWEVTNWRFTAHRSTKWGAKRVAKRLVRRYRKDGPGIDDRVPFEMHTENHRHRRRPRPR